MPLKIPRLRVALRRCARDDKGVALITILIVMLTLSLIGASLFELGATVNQSARHVLEETQARYLAEAGIAHAIYTLKNQAGTPNLELFNEPVQLGEGSFIVTFERGQSLITSTGIVNGVKKTLQLQYNVF